MNNECDIHSWLHAWYGYIADLDRAEGLVNRIRGFVNYLMSELRNTKLK